MEQCKHTFDYDCRNRDQTCDIPRDSLYHPEHTVIIL